MGKRQSASWADVTRAGRRATVRTLFQVIWALTNTTELSNDDIYNMLTYVQEQQDSFNQGYMNYSDVANALYSERGLDIRGLIPLIKKGVSHERL